MKTLSKEKKAVAMKVIDDLKAIKPQADTFYKKQEVLKKKLTATTEREEFHVVIDRIIANNNEIYDVINAITKGVDKDIIEAVTHYFASHDASMSIHNALIFCPDLSQDILYAKEMASARELFDNLPDNIQQAALAFVQSLIKLKPIAKILQNEKELLKQRLLKTKSLQEVDAIEEEILVKNDHALSLYNTMVVFPEDEQSSGEVIKYLDANQHLVALMKTFNFHESLVDDILDATARIHAKSSKNIFGE